MRKRFFAGLSLGLLMFGMAEVASATLIGSYSFEEGTGNTINDSSGQNNNGTLVNLRADTWTTGHSGSGLYFPGITGGSSTYVDLGNPTDFQLNNAFTFTSWVYNDGPWSDAPILAKEGWTGGISYWFGTYYNNFGVLGDHTGWWGWDLDRRAVPVSSWQQWHHLASTWDGTTVNQYLDGILVDTTTYSNTLFNSSEHLTIGVNSGFNFTAFTGTLDDIHIYNSSLTASQINADMNSAPVPEPATMLLFGTGIVGLAGINLRRKKK